MGRHNRWYVSEYSPSDLLKLRDVKLISREEDKYFAVDHDTFVRVNGNPETGLRLPGENSDKFVGTLQWAHQLHCLNIIRQSTWFDIGHYRHMHHFRNKTDEIIIAHTSLFMSSFFSFDCIDKRL